MGQSSIDTCTLLFSSLLIHVSRLRSSGRYVLVVEKCNVELSGGKGWMDKDRDDKMCRLNDQPLACMSYSTTFRP